MDHLAHSTDEHHLADLTEQLVVHQASGMISARDGITCSEALGGLRRYAAITRQPLLALANAIVARSVSPVLDRATLK